MWASRYFAFFSYYLKKIKSVLFTSSTHSFISFHKWMPPHLEKWMEARKSQITGKTCSWIFSIEIHKSVFKRIEHLKGTHCIPGVGWDERGLGCGHSIFSKGTISKGLSTQPHIIKMFFTSKLTHSLISGFSKTDLFKWVAGMDFYCTIIWGIEYETRFFIYTYAGNLKMLEGLGRKGYWTLLSGKRNIHTAILKNLCSHSIN